MSCVTPLDALELIFSKLLEDPPTLRACTLVSQRWCGPAQRALFRRRVFTIGRTPAQLAYDRPAARSAPFSSAAFGVLLASAPHLALCVRRLVYDLGDATAGRGPRLSIAEVLQPLLDWQLRDLLSLELVGYTSCRLFPLARADARLSAVFPLLTHLRLHETRLPDFRTLQSVVCSFPALSSLALSRIHWDPASPAPPSAEHDSVRLLAFELGPLFRQDGDSHARMLEQVCAWLLRSQSRGTLRTIAFSDSMCDDFLALVRGVHDLHLHLRFPLLCSDTSFGTNVTRLTASAPLNLWSLSMACVELGAMAPSSISALHLRFEGGDAKPHYEFVGHHYDHVSDDIVTPAFPEGQFPHLERLEVTFPKHVAHVWNVLALRMAFPRLAWQGAIHFTNTDAEYHPQALVNEESDDDYTLDPLY